MCPSWGGASAAPNTQRENTENIKDIFSMHANLCPQELGGMTTSHASILQREVEGVMGSLYSFLHAKKLNIYMYIYIYTHKYIHVYIYIYVCRRVCT